MSTKGKGIMFSVAGGVFWGFSGVVGKLLFDEKGLTADWLVTSRLVFGGILMLVYAFCKNRGKIFSLWKDKKTAGSMLLFGTFGMMACQLSYFCCVQYSNPATATVLQYISPAIIMLLTLFMEKKMPEILDMAVLVAVIGGVFLMATHGDVHTLVFSKKALLLGLFSAAAVTFYTMWPVKMLKRFGSAIVIGWGMLVGGILLFPLSRFWEVPGKWDGYTVGMVAVVIVIGTICAFGCFLKGVVYLGPVKSSLFACMEPLVSTVLTVSILHERFATADLIGILIIILSVTSLAVRDVWEEKKKEQEGECGVIS